MIKGAVVDILVEYRKYLFLLNYFFREIATPARIRGRRSFWLLPAAPRGPSLGLRRRHQLAQRVEHGLEARIGARLQQA